MKIIYIAYSCDPFNGSEDQIGWNIPFYNSQNNKNEIFVITKREQKNNIEKYFKEKSAITTLSQSSPDFSQSKVAF